MGFVEVPLAFVVVLDVEIAVAVAVYFEFCAFIVEVCVLLLSLGLVGFVGCDSFRRQANRGPDASVHFLSGVKEHDSCWIERKLDLMAKPEELAAACLLFIASTLHSTLYSILY